MSELSHFSRVKPAAAVLVSAALVWSGLPAHARATTVGGLSTVEAGPLAIAGGRLYLPELLTDNQGEAFPGPGPPPTEIETELQSFAGGRHGTHTISLDVSTAGVARPAMAVAGARVAVAWEGAHGFQSGLVSAAATAPGAVATIPASGKVTAYNVAIDALGARAVVWADDVGFRLQVISSSGSPAPPVTLSATGAALFAASSDDDGGWWAVWVGSGRLLAANLAGGSVGATVNLGPAPTKPVTPPRALWPLPWTILADGHGGIWVALAGALLHVHRSGTVERRAFAHQTTLAQGDRRSALVEDLGAGRVVIRPLARSTRPAVLSHVGSPIDIAFDTARQTTYLLSATLHGHVLLTALDGSDRVTSTRVVSGCPRPGTGGLVASGGLVGVACAGKPFEAESVETGGDYEHGRDIRYYLQRGSHRLHSVSLFEGIHAY